MTTRSRFEQRVADLRDTFDQAFAKPPAVLADETEDVLMVRIGGDPYVLRSREMSGLASGKTRRSLAGVRENCRGRSWVISQTGNHILPGGK